MPHHNVHEAIATNITPVNLPTTTETVGVEGPTLVVNNPGGEGVSISGVVYVTPGAGTTGVTVRVRKDSITGPVVGVPITVPATSGSGTVVPFSLLDNTLTGNVRYGVTIQQLGASANGTANLSTIAYKSATLVNH